MAKITNKKRNNLDDSIFGIPSLRKYPLIDKEHTLKAIQMFHHCPIEYKKELAHNINNKAKKYDITISQDSAIYDYLDEEYQIDIDLLEDIHLMERNLYLNEAFGMNEDQAKGCVDTAISLWKKRLQFIQNSQDKSRLLMDVKNEKSALTMMQNKNDLNGILQRAKLTASKMSKVLKTDNYRKIRKFKGYDKYKGNDSESKEIRVRGKILRNVGLGLAGGVALGAFSANRKGNGKFGTAVKVGGGAAAGLAIGGLAAAGSVVKDDIKANKIKRQTNDPEGPIRQYAEKYVNFINSFQSDVLQFQPGQQQEQEDGEMNG